MMKNFVKNDVDKMIDFDAASALMDDEIRESVNYDLAPCTPQEFFDEYCRRHLEEFGEEFAPNVGGAW